MIVKGVMATTHIDKHNCRLTKETLEEMANNICNSDYVPSMSIEHDLTIIPIGKVIKGEISPCEDGEFALQMDSELFEDYSSIKGPEEETYYCASSEIDRRPFADTEIEENDKFTISLDPVNFEDNDYVDIKSYLSNECSVNTETHMRKALIPEPEIVFQLLCGTLFYWTGKKVLEKFAEKVSDDIANSYDYIKKAICKITGKMIPKNRPTTYVFKECDEEVLELVIITERTALVLGAIQPDKINDIMSAIKTLKVFFDEKIAKIQFLFDESKDKWEFNYLTTDQGIVIGTEKCYKKTKKLLEKSFSATKVDLSISGAMNMDQIP